MSQNERDGLQFELDGQASATAEGDAVSNTIMRRCFRVPICSDAAIGVEMDGVNFMVLNLSTGGIGILLKEPEEWVKKDGIKTLTLKIDGQYFEVKARTAHISPYESGDYICGLQFIELNPRMEQALSEFLSRAKKKWFEAQ